MSEPATNRGRLRYLAISLSVVAADQLTKILAHAYLRGKGTVEIIPGFFNLDYSRNPGGLFGHFGDWAEPWHTMVLVVLPVFAILLLSWMLLRSEDNDRRSLVALGLILGGAVGNLIDRLARGEVVDFLDAYVAWPRLADWLVGTFGTAHWPTFNMADSSIVTGASLLALAILRPRSSSAGARSGASPETAGTEG